MSDTVEKLLPAQIRQGLRLWFEQYEGSGRPHPPINEKSAANCLLNCFRSIGLDVMPRWQYDSISGKLSDATTRADQAEARVSSLQKELAEQEREKLSLIREGKGYQLAMQCYLKSPEGIAPLDFIAQLLGIMKDNDTPAPVSPSSQDPAGAAFDELGNLYATIFRDGGHQQQELDALPVDPAHDGLPRRYVEAVKAYWELRRQADLYAAAAPQGEETRREEVAGE